MVLEPDQLFPPLVFAGNLLFFVFSGIELFQLLHVYTDMSMGVAGLTAESIDLRTLGCFHTWSGKKG